MRQLQQVLDSLRLTDYCRPLLLPSVFVLLGLSGAASQLGLVPTLSLLSYSQPIGAATATVLLAHTIFSASVMLLSDHLIAELRLELLEKHKDNHETVASVESRLLNVRMLARCLDGPLSELDSARREFSSR